MKKNSLCFFWVHRKRLQIKIYIEKNKELKIKQQI